MNNKSFTECPADEMALDSIVIIAGVYLKNPAHLPNGRNFSVNRLSRTPGEDFSPLFWYIKVVYCTKAPITSGVPTSYNIKT